MLRRSTLLVLGLLAALGCSSSGGDKFSGVENIQIQATPGEVRFVGVALGGQDSRDVQLAHVGDEGVLEITSVSLVQEKGEFEVTAPDKSALNPGEFTTVTLTYVPKDTIGTPATLRVICNAVNATKGVFEVPIIPVISAEGIRLYPSVLAFEQVPGGTTKDLIVRAQNDGGKPATVTDVELKGGSSADFSLVPPVDAGGTPQAIPHPVLQPGEFVEYTVRYTPLEGNADTGTLSVQYTRDELGTEEEVTASCTGEEIAPNLVVTPGKVDFNKGDLQEDVQVELNNEYTRNVTLQNKGSYKATITDISLIQGPGTEPFDLAQFTLEGWTAGTQQELEPSGKIPLVLHFHPTVQWTPTQLPIARLVVSSDDAANPTIGVDVFAKLTTPEIHVDPPDTVDFSFVAQNFTAEREITITNKGMADLIVSSITLPSNPTVEFALVPNESFGPLASTPAPAAIASDASVTFKVTFTNKGAASGNVFGTLAIASNDPVNPTVQLSLQASRTDLPECKVVLVPPKVNFGTVPHGETKEVNMALKNAGSGNCTFVSARITDCGGFAGMMTSCSSATTTPSSYYKITQMPAPVPDGLKPGGMVNLKVKYTPPNSASMFDFEYYAALLTVTYKEAYTAGDGSFTNHEVPANCAGGLGTTSCQPNLEGKSGTSRISVLPDHLEFGIVTVGCYSQTFKVSIYSTGTAPLTLKNAYLDPACPSAMEFKVKELPPMPTEVDPAAPVSLKVVYHPQDLGPDTCNLLLESSDKATPILKVPLTGEGTFETEHTDEFTQISGQEVDVLFVIDASGSMSDERDMVAANANTFVSEAATWQNDYQLAVMGLCIDTSADCWNTGTFQGPGIMHNTTTGFAETVKNIDSDGCAPDNQESGLEAAHLALTLPRTNLTQIACTSDTQCTAPDKCVSLPDGTKKCGGTNAGFLRDDAALEVIIVSDEQDQSPATPAFYIDWFKSIKGFANPNLMHVHAIVGDANGGCNGSSSEGGADGGDRYIEVQEATDGVFHSICDDDFTSAIKDIGNVAFGLKKQFFLTRSADPTTVKVWVNGTECQQPAWVYDAPSNSIIFDEYGACMPATGDKIKVWYKTVCYNS
jgi:hypothetical protein